MRGVIKDLGRGDSGAEDNARVVLCVFGTGFEKALGGCWFLCRDSCREDVGKMS